MNIACLRDVEILPQNYFPVQKALHKESGKIIFDINDFEQEID